MSISNNTKDHRVIFNEEDFRIYYPYPYSVPKIFPESYPCICIYEKISAGISGDAWQVTIKYPPENIDIFTFRKCLEVDGYSFIV